MKRIANIKPKAETLMRRREDLTLKYPSTSPLQYNIISLLLFSCKCIPSVIEKMRLYWEKLLSPSSDVIGSHTASLTIEVCKCLPSVIEKMRLYWEKLLSPSTDVIGSHIASLTIEEEAEDKRHPSSRTKLVDCS